MDADVRGTLEGMMRRIAVNADAITDEDLGVFVEAFAKGGFRGPINYYRNFDWNWETTSHLAGRKVEQPTLMVLADRDPILRPEGATGMEAHVPDLRRLLIRGCGHWTQQERAAEVNAALIDFLADLR